jgi:hypothetical protein
LINLRTTLIASAILSQSVFFFLHHPNLAASRPGHHAGPGQRLIPDAAGATAPTAGLLSLICLD